MNSKQRRRDKRIWRYKISTYPISYVEYNEMWKWLVSKHGKLSHCCGWRDRVRYNALDACIEDELLVDWQFVKEKHAIEFALRWL